MDTDLLISTFNENISYIEQHHPLLFSKLVALDSAVANGHYREKYEIVFENGYFDVFEKSSGNYLYTKNSNEYASLAAKSIDFKLENNLFICSPEHEISDERLDYYNNLAPLQDYMSGIAPILNFTQKRMDAKDSLKRIEKFIFFGVGLGLHIKEVDKKIKASSYLIVEDDLELFRLSLFTTNYKTLSRQSKLFFSVFEDESEFLNTSELFLQEQYEHNKYIKYFEMLSHSESKREKFHMSVTSQAHLRFSYAAMLTQNLLPLEHLFDDSKFLDKSITLLGSKLEDKPFLLLGAGPSLQKNIQLLRKNAQKFVVVAVSSTLSFLEKNAIVPDIIMHLDAFGSSLRHFDSLKSLEFIKNSICLFSAKTNPLITLRLQKENIFFYEDSTSYKEHSFRPSSPCVGSLSYQILLYLKARKIYLLGLDLSVDSQTGMTHSNTHSYARKLDISSQDKESGNIEYKSHLLSVNGNKTQSVFTTPHFKSSIETINYSTKVMKQDFQHIVNFSTGAQFENIDADDFENFHSDEILSDVKGSLEELFSKKVSKKLTKNEKNALQKRVDDAKQIRELLQKYNETQSKSSQEYKENLLKLIKVISQDENDVTRALNLYFRYLIPYIFDYFNRENVSINEKDFRVINEMFVGHLMHLI